jgi:heme exporter protein A
MSHVTPSRAPSAALQLCADSLAVEAGPLRLFEAMSFRLKSGEALILRGPNGSGKTSLLKAIAGLYPLAAGEIKFQADAAGENDVVYNIAENCHFLGHKNGLKGERTIRQNLAFFASFEGAPKARINAAAATLNLMPLLDLPVGLLSAGQARRAAFARLLIGARPIWLLDEPTSALDDISRGIIEASCRAHLKTGGLLLVSTHLPFFSDADMIQVLQMADFTASAS